MGLEDVLENIEAQKGKQIAGIVEQSENETGRIIREAKEEASELASMEKKKTIEESRQLLVRELSKANIESRMILNNALNEKVEKAIEGIGKNIGGYMKRETYRKLLVVLAKGAFSELGHSCTVLSRNEDADYLKKVFTGNNVKGDSKMSGGIIAVSEDGKREIDHSIGSIIESTKGDIASEILKRIKGAR